MQIIVKGLNFHERSCLSAFHAKGLKDRELLSYILCCNVL